MQHCLKEIVNDLRLLEAWLACRVVRKPIKQPVFLLGCGRSGKTTLGNALSRHPEITFLDEESRAYWIASYPETDVWSARASARGGKLIFTDKDTCETSNRRLQSLFNYKTIKTGKPVLFHSLAVNNFRLPFIASIFPDVQFIHIVRNGVEVAKSIKECADRGKWYGYNEYKWQQLLMCASANPDTAKLITLCKNNYDRGLLEWRLSLEALDAFALTIPKDRLLELSYDDFVELPVEAVRRILSFVGLSGDDEFENSVRQMIHDGEETIQTTDFCEKELAIAGSRLEKWSLSKPENLDY